MTCPTKELLEQSQKDDRAFMLNEIVQAVAIVTTDKVRHYGPLGLEHYDQTIDFLHFKFGESFDVKANRRLIIQVLITVPGNRLEYHPDGSTSFYLSQEVEPGEYVNLLSRREGPPKFSEDGPISLHEVNSEDNSAWGLWKKAHNRLAHATLSKRNAVKDAKPVKQRS